MSETPKAEDVIDITGPASETLFWHAVAWLVAGKEEAIQADLDETWRHYREIKDDRLVALVAALCIESSLDVLLKSIAPGFDQYVADTDFTFSVKIKVVRSLQLLPARILTSCDFVRMVRNQFAHNVAYKRFEDLPDEKFMNKLGPYVKAFSSAEQDPGAPQRHFKDLVGFTLTALRVYTEQVRRLRDYVASEVGRADFRRYCEQGAGEAQRG